MILMGYNIKSKRVKTGKQFTIQTKPASFKRKFESERYG